MLTHRDFGMVDITFEEFCVKTNISPNHKMFDDVENPIFYKCVDHVRWNQPRKKRPTQYYYNNRKGLIREFKYVYEQKETVTRTFDMSKDPASWGTWTTWNNFD